MSEHDEQSALLSWAATRQAVMPELEYLMAIPNGGYRAKTTGRKLKAEGLRAGVPDLFLPVARQSYHGLWLEMKISTGRVTEKQSNWHEWLRGQGYQVRVCYCWQDAAEMIEIYMGVPASRRTEFWAGARQAVTA